MLRDSRGELQEISISESCSARVVFRLSRGGAMARYLVTGGCGFIGSHLAEALLANDDEVRILDNLSIGCRDNAPGGADVIVGDVADPVALQQAMAGTDGVFHLAAIAAIERSIDDWVGTHASNLTGCITAFDATRRACGGAGSRDLCVVGGGLRAHRSRAPHGDYGGETAHALRR